MPELTIDFVKGAVKGIVCGKAPLVAFERVTTDTRQDLEQSLFVALKGDNFDAHDFVGQAFEKGAKAAIVRKGFSLPLMPDACLIEVEDTLYALGELARAWRKEFDLPLIAITGSNGKTTTKEMLASILSLKDEILKNKGNLNNLIGLPLTLLGLNGIHKLGIVEMGMNQPGEIARLMEIASCDAGLITNVGPAHIGPMGSIEAVAKAKTEMFAGLNPKACAVINMDDPFLRPWADKLKCRVVTFAKENKAQITCKDVSALGTRQALTLCFPNGEQKRVRLGAPGIHNVQNALAASAGAFAMGIDSEQIKQGLEAFEQVPGRLAYKKSMWGYAVVDDTYNANPASLKGGLEALKPIASGRPMGLVLGDMLELGPTSPELHQEAGRMAVRAGCQMVFAFGEFSSDVVKGAIAEGLDPLKAKAFDDFLTLVETCFDSLMGDEVVLVKGSRSMRMERLVKALVTGEIG